MPVGRGIVFEIRGIMPRSFCRLSLALLAVLAAGCSQEESIRSYAVPKPRPVKAVAGPAMDDVRGAGPMQAPQVDGDRIFGAIVLRGDKGWFFKATGSREALTPHATKLIDFVKSVRFREDGTPTWTLPDDWTEKPGNAIRFTTLALGKEEGAPELSVTVLPKNEEDEAYVLANVNRWRGQLGMGATDAARLKQQSLEIPLADGYVSRVVVLAAGAEEGSGSSAVPEESLELTKFDTPTGWTDRGASGERKASLAVGTGEKALDISITSFSASREQMANPLANINRWRGQLGLPSATPDEIGNSVKETRVSGFPGAYVEILGPEDAKPQKATFAAMFLGGPDVWFIKLTGDAELAKSERDNFKKLLDSIRVSPPGQTEPQGATDGK
jgi:hypothetical protein